MKKIFLPIAALTLLSMVAFGTNKAIEAKAVSSPEQSFYDRFATVDGAGNVAPHSLGIGVTTHGTELAYFPNKDSDVANLFDFSLVDQVKFTFRDDTDNGWDWSTPDNWHSSRSDLANGIMRLNFYKNTGTNLLKMFALRIYTLENSWGSNCDSSSVQLLIFDPTGSEVLASSWKWATTHMTGAWSKDWTVLLEKTFNIKTHEWHGDGSLVNLFAESDIAALQDAWGQTEAKIINFPVVCSIEGEGGWCDLEGNKDVDNLMVLTSINDLSLAPSSMSPVSFNDTDIPAMFAKESYTFKKYLTYNIKDLVKSVDLFTPKLTYSYQITNEVNVIQTFNEQTICFDEDLFDAAFINIMVTDSEGHSYSTGNIPLSLVEGPSFAVQLFVETYLSNSICDPTGVNAPTVDWAAAKAAFLALTEEEQNYLLNTLGDELGDVVEQAMARYDYIVAKYGVEQYENFIGRGLIVLSSNRIDSFNRFNSNISITIIAFSSLIIGTTFFIVFRRKKKVNNK